MKNLSAFLTALITILLSASTVAAVDIVVTDADSVIGISRVPASADALDALDALAQGYSDIYIASADSSQTVGRELPAADTLDALDALAQGYTDIYIGFADRVEGILPTCMFICTNEIIATLDIDPDTLNLNSNGNWFTAYIELSSGSPEDIILDSLLLEGMIPAVIDVKYGFVIDAGEYIVDHDADGILERLVKFDRGALQGLLSPAEEITLTVSGETADGVFEANDTIRVIGSSKDLKVSLKVDKRIKNEETRTKVTIDLQTQGNQKAKAVYVKEYIPEDLTVRLTDGTYAGFGLIWQAGVVDKKETVYYTLNLPEVSEPTSYELKTVVEYQTVDDLEVLERTTTLTIYPRGQVTLGRGSEKKSIKAKDKGYSKVQWALPSSKADDNEPKGKKKGHDKDKGNNGNGNGGGKGKK